MMAIPSHRNGSWRMVLLLSTARKDPVEDEFSRVVNALSALIREIASIGGFFSMTCRAW